MSTLAQHVPYVGQIMRSSFRWWRQRTRGMEGTTPRQRANWFKSLAARRWLEKTAEGVQLAMSYAVAPVSVTLDSVSQICDSGAEVHFNRSGGNIIDADGTRTGFRRVGDTYLRETWIERPFKRQGLSS